LGSKIKIKLEKKFEEVKERINENSKLNKDKIK
jgi:hypothetical protein